MYRVKNQYTRTVEGWERCLPDIDNIENSLIYYNKVNLYKHFESPRCIDYLSHNWTMEDLCHSWKEVRGLDKTKIEYNEYNEKTMYLYERLEFISWRLWAKLKNNLGTINPRSLEWDKESDIQVLYGPYKKACNTKFYDIPSLSCSYSDFSDSYSINEEISKSCLKKEVFRLYDNKLNYKIPKKVRINSRVDVGIYENGHLVEKKNKHLNNNPKQLTRSNNDTVTPIIGYGDEEKSVMSTLFDKTFEVISYFVHK